MTSIFSKPKAVKMPAPPPPPAMPVESSDAGDYAAMMAKKRSGFRKTILTGALAPTTGKKTTLG